MTATLTATRLSVLRWTRRDSSRAASALVTVWTKEPHALLDMGFHSPHEVCARGVDYEVTPMSIAQDSAYLAESRYRVDDGSRKARSGPQFSARSAAFTTRAILCSRMRAK